MAERPPMPPSDPAAQPMTPRRRQILDDALLQLRRTRDQVDPALLARIRVLIGDRTPADLMAVPAVSSDRAENMMTDDVRPGFVPVDRKRNLQIIRMFLELQPENKNVQTKVRTLMAEYFN